MAFQQELRQKAEEAAKVLAEEQKRGARPSWPETKRKGVVTLASGLQYNS
jgi:FKBP-type peptidyl-prolyl cis-trans isomerase